MYITYIINFFKIYESVPKRIKINMIRYCMFTNICMYLQIKLLLITKIKEMEVKTSLSPKLGTLYLS